MLDAFVAFLPVAIVLTITPGVATALVVRNAARGGRRGAFFTTAGNSIGVFTWGCCAAVGIATVVAASATAFSAVKLAGAVVLVVMGLQALFGRHERPDTRGTDIAPAVPDRVALRDGLITSLSNPKLAVFFVALFPQFLPPGVAVLPATLAMTALIVFFDLIWYSVLALAVARARRAFVEGPWRQRFERFTGAVLVALGVRLAFEQRH
jgi:threonine/homoserine/homoserine lactone efflux protein